MKKKILVITLAMALVMTSACGSKKNDKSDNSKKQKETSEATVVDDTEEANDKASKATEEATESTPEETTTEATTEPTTEATTEETTTVPTETTERDATAYVYDLSEMTAEQIADLCDGLTTRKVPQVGDTIADVHKEYFDVEPWIYKAGFDARYSVSEKDNVNAIFLSGLYCGDDPEKDETVIERVEIFGTGLIIDIYDRAKAEEFIKIMKERHPVLEQKPDGSWKAEDFVVGITPIDYFSWDNGVHFQIAYGEKSIWYESVAGIFGFGMEITIVDPTDTSETTAA